MNYKNKASRRLMPLVLLIGMLAACVNNSSLDRSRAEFAADTPESALASLEQRVRQESGNTELRAYYMRQRERLAGEYIFAGERAVAAGDFDQAEHAFHRALEIDAGQHRAAAGLESLVDERRREERLVQGGAALARGETDLAERLVRSVLAESPANTRARSLLRDIEERQAQQRSGSGGVPVGVLAKPVSLHFRDAPLRAVFEALAQFAKLNFVFDREIRDDGLVTLVVRDTTVGEVLRLLSATQQIETRVINANSVMVYPSTPAKQREYQEMVSRSIYLTHADAKQAQALIKQLVKTKDVFIDEKLNLVVIKDTPEAVAMAERLIASLDVAEPEVMLEVQVLEVSRTKLRDIGLELQDQIGYGLLVNGSSGALAAGNVSLLRNTGQLTTYTANPAAVLNILSKDSDTVILANPRIRVKNRAAAKVHIGDKVPVFTTTSTANVGVATSVTYLDIGLKLDVEPSVTLDSQVAIKIGLEVSNIVSEVRSPEGALAYRVGTRSAATNLRLKNGETQVLAGLISDEDRLTARRIPLLGDLPIVGRLFSSNGADGLRSEIVLLITPRILRNVVPPVSARNEMPAGTEASVGQPPLRVGGAGSGSISLSSGSALATAGMPPPAAAQQSPPPVAGGTVPAAVGPEGLSVRLIAPATAKPGETVMLTIELGGRGRIDGGVLDLSYDAGLLDPIGISSSAPGKASVSLGGGPLPSGVTASFQVKSDAKGTASIAVTGARLDAVGQPVPSALSGSISIAITP